MTPIHDSRFTSERRAALVDDGSHIVRREYLKPIFLGGTGLVVLVIMFLTQSRGASSLSDALGIIIGITVQVALGIPALLVASALLGGGAGPLNLAILRLIGILLAVAPVAIFMGGVPIYGWLVALLLMGFLIMLLFDFELYEAAVVLCILGGINIVTMVVVIPLFFT